jgi:hypothetical protein
MSVTHHRQNPLECNSFTAVVIVNTESTADILNDSAIFYSACVLNVTLIMLYYSLMLCEAEMVRC